MTAYSKDTVTPVVSVWMDTANTIGWVAYQGKIHFSQFWKLKSKIKVLADWVSSEEGLVFRGPCSHMAERARVPGSHGSTNSILGTSPS